MRHIAMRQCVPAPCTSPNVPPLAGQELRGTRVPRSSRFRRGRSPLFLLTRSLLQALVHDGHILIQQPAALCVFVRLCSCGRDWQLCRRVLNHLRALSSLSTWLQSHTPRLPHTQVRVRCTRAHRADTHRNVASGFVGWSHLRHDRHIFDHVPNGLRRLAPRAAGGVPARLVACAYSHDGLRVALKRLGMAEAHFDEVQELL